MLFVFRPLVLGLKPPLALGHGTGRGPCHLPGPISPQLARSSHRSLLGASRTLPGNPAPEHLPSPLPCVELHLPPDRLCLHVTHATSQEGPRGVLHSTSDMLVCHVYLVVVCLLVSLSVLVTAMSPAPSPGPGTQQSSGPGY